MSPRVAACGASVVRFVGPGQHPRDQVVQRIVVEPGSNLAKGASFGRSEGEATGGHQERPTGEEVEASAATDSAAREWVGRRRWEWS